MPRWERRHAPLPLIEILPAPDPAQVEQAFAQAEVSTAGAMFMFVSPECGVLGALRRRGRRSAASDARTLGWPAQARAAATGTGNRRGAAHMCGVPAEAIVAARPRRAAVRSESLWSEIADWPWPGRPVWIVRGNGGRDWLGRQLRDAGADVRFVQSYGRAAPVLSADEQALLAAALAAPARWIWMFSSSEAIDHLQALGPGAQWAAGRALASHPRIAERALALGSRVGDARRAGSPPRCRRLWRSAHRPVWDKPGGSRCVCGVVDTMRRVTDDLPASMSTPPPIAALPYMTPAVPAAWCTRRRRTCGRRSCWPGSRPSPSV